MRRFKEAAGMSFAGAILMLVLLVMFEVVTFPNSHHWVGWFVVGYLSLVLVLLGWEILQDLLHWLQGGKQ